MSGLLHINSIGLADKWITGSPSFSYYLSQFKRSSKFSFETIEKKFENDLLFDNIITCNVPVDEGDLIENISVLFELSSDHFPVGTQIPQRWRSQNLGTNMIEYAEFIIGGQVVHKITGDYIFIENVTNISQPVQITTLFNNTEKLYHYFKRHYEKVTGNIRILMNLPFYFYQNPKLSVPLCALSKHSVQVRIKLNRIGEVLEYPIYWSTTTANQAFTIYKNGLDNFKILNASLYINYVYLSDDERNFLKTRPIEHVITQLQVATFNIDYDLDGGKKTVRLNFKHPVKELIIRNRQTGYLSFFYNDSGYLYNGIPKTETTSPVEHYPGQFLGNVGSSLSRATFKINNSILFDEDGRTLLYLTPLRHKIGLILSDTAIDPFIGFYSFATDPNNPKPTGHINMSRISNQEITVRLQTVDDPRTDLILGLDQNTILTLMGSLDQNRVDIYAINYNVITFNSGLGGLKYS